MSCNLAGKVAIVTGASSGIGRAVALQFSSVGALLSLWGRNEAALDNTKQECIRCCGIAESAVICCKAEMTDDQQLRNSLKATIDHFGRLDVLVNCAGIMMNGSIRDGPIEDYDRVMNINVRSVIRLTQLCVPKLVSTKGVIVNVSSTASTCAYPSVAYYCISKAALDHFTRCLALDLAPDGVRVNSVNPGVIVTELHRRGGFNEEQYMKFLERAKTLHPLGRVGDADEVAAAVAFLASSQSSFITGELLKVDAGRSLVSPR